MKGPVTRLRLYAPNEPRPVADVDLLVAARGHRRARTAMATLGYRRIVTGIHSDVLRGPSGDVDLHFALPFTSVPLSRAFAALRDCTGHLALDGHIVPVLDVPTHVVHLALHAAQNRFTPDHRSFEEWRRGFASLHEADRSHAAETARCLGVGPVWKTSIAALEPGADLTHLASTLPRRRPPPTARGIVAFARSPLAPRLRLRAVRALVHAQVSDTLVDAWRAERGLAPVPRETLALTRAKVERFGVIAAERTRAWPSRR